MATVVRTYWINPRTGDVYLPELPGDILNAACAYWEDELNEWRPKRPRTVEAREEKQRRVETAVERLHRFRNARDWFALDFRKLDKLTLELATSDLRKVMKVKPAERSAA